MQCSSIAYFLVSSCKKFKVCILSLYVKKANKSACENCWNILRFEENVTVKKVLIKNIEFETLGTVKLAWLYSYSSDIMINVSGFLMNGYPSVAILRTSSLSVPVCSWCVVQLFFGLENHHFQLFSLALNLGMYMCTVAKSFVSLPTVAYRHYELNIYTEIWDRCGKERKDFAKMNMPMFKFSKSGYHRKCF